MASSKAASIANEPEDADKDSVTRPPTRISHGGGRPEGNWINDTESEHVIRLTNAIKLADISMYVPEIAKTISMSSTKVGYEVWRVREREKGKLETP